MNTTPKIELALHWLRELRPNLTWTIERIGPTVIEFKGTERLIAPGAQFWWISPPWMTTETIEVHARTATVRLWLNHRDIASWNDTAPEMVKFMADD